MEKRVKVFGFNFEKRLFFCQHTLVDEINGYLQRCGGRALSVSSLEHEKLAALYGKLQILHVAIMLFKNVCYLDEPVIDVGHSVCQLIYMGGRADSRNYILALRVHKVFAV